MTVARTLPAEIADLQPIPLASHSADSPDSVILFPKMPMPSLRPCFACASFKNL